tara:strand:- start:4201 stop:4584 length:384 start_codon:yes stop_codon:yes gene_type:complete
MGDITKNFSKSEFDCNCGCEMPEDILDNIEVHAHNLQTIRDFLNKPIKINSAYRCPSYNSKIGGASKSEHKNGNASDLSVSSHSPGELADIIEGLIRIGAIEEGGLGRYNTFTHYDRRGSKARWDNT